MRTLVRRQRIGLAPAAVEGVGVSGTLLALGGAISRVGEDTTAFSHRDAAFDFQAVTSWTDPGEDDQRRADVRRYADAMKAHARGVYLNSLGDEGDDRVRAAYGSDKYDRLVALKRRYDPQNVFHLNQNIRP